MKLEELIKKRREKRRSDILKENQVPVKAEPGQKLSPHLHDIRKKIEKRFGQSMDLVISSIIISGQQSMFCYLSSMVDDSLIAEKLVSPISNTAELNIDIHSHDGFSHFCDTVFVSTFKKFVTTYAEAFKYILDGYCVLFVEDLEKCVALKIQNIPYRQISEPTTQTNIRGPKDAFTESADINISLIRRRLRTPDLRIESISIGEDAAVSIFVCYIDGITNENIVEEVRTRIKNAKANFIYDSGYLEEFIQDETFTPFPLVFNSERPDTVTAGLIEGKVAIIVGESPFVLLVPTIFSDFFQVSEDYFQQFMMVSIVRLIRYGSFMLSLILPSIYLGLISYHQELIPTQLLISIISQREGIPFPIIFEVVLMELTFEILREAGIRMPRAIGMTVSVVGGLVIGQAAVEAGLISNIMVIIVALTGIAGFVSPSYSFSMAARLLRFCFVLLAACFGLYGVMLGLMVMVAHLNSLRSFGVPYLSSVALMKPQDQKDTFLRLPLWMMKKRPSHLNTEKPIKQSGAARPKPPEKGDGDS